MQRRPTWRIFTVAAVAAAAVAAAWGSVGPAVAQTPPPWTVTVAGQPVTIDDVGQALAMEMAMSGLQSTPKAPSAMPSFAPLVWYAGRDSTGRPIVWRRSGPIAADGTERQESIREFAVAAILVQLDGGKGGPTLQRLFRGLPDDAGARVRFAREIEAAVQSASAWTEASYVANRRWVFANVHAEMTRRDVYLLLARRGLRPTDQSQRGSSPDTGVAYVTLAGAFEPGCSWSHTIAITFDSSDRVRKVDLAPPHPNCL
jgi:hypothetical protein